MKLARICMQTRYSTILYIYPLKLARICMQTRYSAKLYIYPHKIGKDLYANYTDVTPAAADPMFSISDTDISI